MRKQKRIRTTFQYIDKLLSEAEHTMADAGSPSPFRTHSDDARPIQRKVTHDYILRIREAMRRVMEELNIPPSEPHSGAVWAAAINLMFCSISLNELTPERMHAYGPLSPDAADKLDGIRAELDGLVGKLRSYLGKGAGGDLQQRLQQLGKTGDEIRLLSEIERIITAHGLVEFRGTLNMLLDRMEGAAFEVGVFGRVSSGKSSLLNYILQTDVLPIGVTPVTAIPTRISHGPVAEAGIEFAEAQPQIIALSELPEFATEQKNPGNKKHVTRIFVKLPSVRLAEGVTFVDTPGLGSLAVAGAEETIAYLPRCDLGIVLIDASAGLTQDDLVVVQALYQAGASAMILISKADLFSGADRDHAGYFQQADEGTLFLDEVGELSPECQAKLLRVIEGKGFRPVGAESEIQVNVRIVAATNRDLEADASRFRRDLFFRLQGVQIRVPPLRDRLEDIPELADHFLKRLGADWGRTVKLTAGAVQRLQAYSWPGNVRQFRTLLEGAVALADKQTLDSSDLILPSDPCPERPHTLNLEEVEAWAIRQVLAQTKNNVTQAAQLLGIGRDTLANKMKKYGIGKD